jgi:hypothetical protein
MDARDYVGPTAIRASVLPARAAYLIAAESEAGLRSAIQEACTRWGGMTEPIIPVRPGSDLEPWWSRVVSLSRADIAVNIDADPTEAAATARALGLDLVPLAMIDRVGIGAFTVHPSAVGPDELPGYNAYVMASEKLQLWEVTGAGNLTNDHLDSIPQGTFYTQRPMTDDQVARAQLTGSTLVERTCSQFGEHSARGGPAPAPAIVWVAEPNSFEDCLHFWNLRALRPLRLGTAPMLLMPAGQVAHWLNFLAELGHVLERPDQFKPDVALLSMSLTETALRETAELLGLQESDDAPRIGYDWPVPTRQAPFTYRLDLNPRTWLEFERSYGELVDVDVQLFRAKTPVRFRSPVSFRTAGGTALVRMSGAALEGFPRRDAVAKQINSTATWRDDSLQITAHAVNEYLFDIHIPELSEVTSGLLADATTRHQLSDKGKPGMAWLERGDVAVLARPGVFAAIRELTTPRSKSLFKELRKLQGDGAANDELVQIASQWGRRSERRYRSADLLEHTPKEEAASALEQLAYAGWAERGLQVNCSTCGIPGFVPLPQTSGQPECPGCSSPAAYEFAAALIVHYRLNSYLDLLSDQGVLPHLLTISALQRQGRQTHFLPGVDVWFGLGDKAEIDIFGVLDGQILVGEVKTSAIEFTADQIARDVALTARLAADTYVLAATDTISDEISETAKQKCQASGLGLIVLGKTELLPSC